MSQKTEQSIQSAALFTLERIGLVYDTLIRELSESNNLEIADFIISNADEFQAMVLGIVMFEMEEDLDSLRKIADNHRKGKVLLAKKMMDRFVNLAKKPSLRLTQEDAVVTFSEIYDRLRQLTLDICFQDA